MGCHGCGCSCTQPSVSRLFMQTGNHRHRGWSAKNWEVSRINRQRIHFSTGGLGSSGFFRWEQWNFYHASLLNALLFTRRSTSWQLFEAADFNGSSDQQCGLCSRNCERQTRSKNFITYNLFLNLYIIAASKNFYRSTGIVAGMSSLLVVSFCYWDSDWYGAPGGYSLSRN